MLKQLRPAILRLIAPTLITGLLYPVAIMRVAQVLFPYQANGSLIVEEDNAIGAERIGQLFSDVKCFHRQPSATTKADPNEPSKTVDARTIAADSPGVNLGPTNKALIEGVKADMETLRAENPAASLPIELVTTSGSGLDSQISREAALFQVAWPGQTICLRIASATWSTNTASGVC
jgi:potassium-transporting ATPase KdpC subunit